MLPSTSQPGSTTISPSPNGGWKYAGAHPTGAFADKVLDNVNKQFDASVTWEDAREQMNARGGKFIQATIGKTGFAFKILRIFSSNQKSFYHFNPGFFVFRLPRISLRVSKIKKPTIA